MIERGAHEAQDVGSIVDESLVGDLPCPPVCSRISRRDRALTVRHRVGGIGEVFARLRRRFRWGRRVERQRTVGVKIEVCRFRLSRWPRRVGPPTVGAGLEGCRPPSRLRTLAVQVITEEWSFDRLAEFARGLVAAQRNEADTIALRRLPLAVIPRTSHHEVRVIRIILSRMPEDLPRTPRIFLIPETGDVEVGNRRRVELIDSSLLLPERVVVRMCDEIVPEGNGSVEIAGIDVLDAPQSQIPRIRIVFVELEIRVLVF